MPPKLIWIDATGAPPSQIHSYTTDQYDYQLIMVVNRTTDGRPSL